MTPPQTLPGDSELVQSAQDGNLEAFTLLYERYLPMVCNRVRYTIPPEDVEDVTQEVFICAMRSINGFRGEAKFGTWLRTLTIRQIAEYYRRRKHTYLPLDENLKAPHNPGGSDEAILLRQAFKKLPEPYREVLLLRFAEDMPFNEIARLQKRNIESVKSLFRRAVAALQKQVTHHD